MIAGKLIYAAVILLLAGFSILYIDSMALVMLCACLMLPLFLGAVLALGSRKMKIGIDVFQDTGCRDEAVLYEIVIEKVSRLPVYCKIVLCAENCFTGEIVTNSFKGLICGKKQRLSGKIKSSHSGKIKVNVKKAYVFDYLRLFRKRIKTEAGGNVLIFPILWEIDGQLVTMPVLDDDGDIYSKTKSGSDPSEIFDIREFRQDDDPKRIHWKLSAKADGYFVKEYGQPMLNAIVLLLENENAGVDIFDNLLDLLFSLSNFLLEQGVAHIVCLQNSEGDLSYCRIASGEELYEALSGILNLPRHNSFEQYSALNQYINDSQNKHTHLIYLTANKNAAENQLLREQSVPVTAMITVKGNIKSFSDENNFRCIYVKSGDVSKSLAGLEL